jgi:wyosine [tRNA(Phe)-imidazoG37] synthetase (radical SAM superfamily)
LNVLPKGVKRCPFNCVYCEAGSAAPADALRAGIGLEQDVYPSPESIFTALRAALGDSIDLDAITFSGAGEPTMHPRFREVVEGVTRLRDRYRPAVKVIVLSNGALVDQSDVHAGLALADVRLMKLDAGDQETYQAINRPGRAVPFERIVRHLSKLEDITLQTMLLDGAVSNVSPAARSAYLEVVRQLRPTSVQLYSLSRATPVGGLRAVEGDIFRAFADGIEALGIRVYAYQSS